MIKLINLLNEGKQVGLLYHWTDFMGSMNIISQDFLKGYLTDTFREQPAISFTRNKNFYKGKNKLATKPEICFVIDGDKLSNHYKIQPFQDPKVKKDEMEEKVLTEGIKNFSQYITNIIIVKNRFNKSFSYSVDTFLDKWKNVGGEGFPTYENYVKWLTDKEFSIETILKETMFINSKGELIDDDNKTKDKDINNLKKLGFDIVTMDDKDIHWYWQAPNGNFVGGSSDISLPILTKPLKSEIARNNWFDLILRHDNLWMKKRPKEKTNYKDHNWFDKETHYFVNKEGKIIGKIEDTLDDLLNQVQKDPNKFVNSMLKRFIPGVPNIINTNY